jgi:capsular polysaccharide biosynthesis protein
LLNASVAAVLGLLLGLWWALAAEKRDPRVRTIADITERLQLPLLLRLPAR